MSEFELGTWSARLPDWINGSLSEEDNEALERAMAADPELRAEAEFVARLGAARPSPPADLPGLIGARLDRERSNRSASPDVPSRPSRFPGRWQLSTAAILLLALGTSVVWRNQARLNPANLPNEVDDPVAESWQFDDGIVAGGAVLGELSDAELTSLLDDMGV